MKLIFIILYSINLFAAHPEDNCNVPVKWETEHSEVGETVTKDCSAEVIKSQRDTKLSHNENFNLSEYYQMDGDKLCTCLKEAKFNEIGVPSNRKKSFKQWEYDQAIREKLNHSLKDLVGNFTKFNNLILTKDHLGNLIDDQTGPLCNIKTLGEEVEKLQKLEGTDACPSPKGFMQNRLQAIFGTKNMKELPEKLKKMTTEVGPKSCISNQLYLNLRSNNGATGRAFYYLDKSDRKKGDFKNAFHNPSSVAEEHALKDLLSYDVIFNLAYRDDSFRKDFKDRLAKFTGEMKQRQFDIYNDTPTLKLAYKHLNNNCNDFTKNLKNFLCANEYPKLNPATLNLHLDDYFKGDDEHPITKQKMRDHFTWDYACNDERRATVYRRSVIGALTGAKKQAVELSPEEDEFNKHIEKTILVKNATKDVFSNEPTSDYSKFNEMFCKGREGKEISKDQLPEMMKQYFADKKASGLDLEAFLKQNANLVGLSFNPGGNPAFNLANKADVDAGKLPRINQITWEEKIAPLLAGKMDKAEIDQLYAIIEMQTNRKFTEVEDLKKKLVAENKAYENLSLRDIDAVVRGDQAVIARLQTTSTSTPSVDGTPAPAPLPDPVTAIQDRYQALQTDISQRSNSAQDVLLSTTDVSAVKADAQVYNRNQGTYDENYGSRRGGESFDSSSQVQEPSRKLASVSNTSPTTVASRTPASDNSSSSDNSSGIGNGGSVSQASTSLYSNAGASAAIGNTGRSSDRSSSDRESSNDVQDSSSGKKSFADMKRDFIDKLKDNDRVRGNSRMSDLDSEIQRLEKELENGQKAYNAASRELGNAQRMAALDDANARSRAAQRSSSNYNFPKNLPVKTQNGDYYLPENKGSELSSASKDSAEARKAEDEKKSLLGGAGAKGAGGAPGKDGDGKEAGIGAVDMGSLAGIGGNIAGGKGRGPASVESEAEIRKKLNLSPYEHHKYVPHAIFDVVGSVDKVVLLLGLEGKSFKTIEAIEEFDKDTAKINIKYKMRTFDFVPEGEFEEFKEDFSTKEGREKAYQAYFTYPRNKDNLKVSKRYAMATKEVAKEEVTHSYVLKIQNYILSEEEIRDTINKVMEQLK